MKNQAFTYSSTEWNKLTSGILFQMSCCLALYFCSLANGGYYLVNVEAVTVLDSSQSKY